MKKIGIIGCGWLGGYIAKYFSEKNLIYTTTTSQKKKIEFTTTGYNSVVVEFFDYEIFKKQKSWSVIEELDILIITVPFSKRTSIESLKNRFENICLFIGDFKNQIFLMSSIGIYPQVEIDISENSLENIHLNPNILFVEQLMKERFNQINILRLGGLMGGSRIFSNYKISKPNQIVNHIHYEDIIFVIEKMILKNSSSQTYNVVAPLHPTKQEIINYQKEINHSIKSKKCGRKILSNLLIDDLNYNFSHPNPVIYK